MAKLTKILGLGAACAMAGSFAFAQEAATPAPETAAPEAGASEATASTEAPTADTVVATVDGTEITLGQMIVVRDGLPPQYAQLDGQTLFNGILDQLIQQTALSKLGEDRMTKRDRIALEVQRRAYLAGSMLEYSAQRATTEEAIETEYKTRFESSEPVTEYHAAHIIVDSEEKAAELKAEIDNGADFAELARENSTDGAADNGGDLGWFGLDMMVQPFAEAVSEMEPGEVRGPVQTQYGWHVVQLIETRMADVPALEDVRDEIEAELHQQAMSDRVTRTVDEATVERMVDGIDPSVLADETLLAE